MPFNILSTHMYKNLKPILYLAVFILLKYLHSISTSMDLLFLLSPTSYIVELMIDMESTLIRPNGFYFPIIDVLIDKSCSGFNLLLICLLMLGFLPKDKFKIPILVELLMSISVAYIFTILVNALRIYVCIYVSHVQKINDWLGQDIAHSAVGIFTNLSFLILLFILVHFLFSNKNNEKLTISVMDTTH